MTLRRERGMRTIIVIPNVDATKIKVVTLLPQLAEELEVEVEVVDEVGV